MQKITTILMVILTTLLVMPFAFALSVDLPRDTGEPLEGNQPITLPKPKDKPLICGEDIECDYEDVPDPVIITDATPTKETNRGESSCNGGFEFKDEYLHFWADLSRGLSIPYIPGMFKFACFN